MIDQNDIERLEFQSTHPVRGATPRRCCNRQCVRISIHAPRAGCDSVRTRCSRCRRISIHAPRAGCDDEFDFLQFEARHISIHAPRAGCDNTAKAGVHFEADFNPRTPCGVRRRDFCTMVEKTPFQSTHPVRGATIGSTRCRRRGRYFNPRTPCGVRRRWKLST